jgi:hypothetical protein
VHAAETPAAEETGRGSIQGTLYQPDEKGPLAGAKVTAINVRTGKQYAATSRPKTVTSTSAAFRPAHTMW